VTFTIGEFGHVDEHNLLRTAPTGWLDVTRLGCVGDDSTDNATALRAAFLTAASLGRAIFIPAGVFRTSQPIDFLANTMVWCVGTLKITADNSAGAFLLVKQGDDNINWVGGTIDGGGDLGVVNMNGIAAAYDPLGSTPCYNVRFSGVRVINCREDPELTPELFSGGGKGLTLQFDLNGGVFSDLIIEDCDVPFSIESAASGDRYTENCVISNVVARNCKRGAFLAGSRPVGTSSLDDWGYTESRFSQTVLRNITLDNCGTHTGFGANFGAITANYATCIDGEFNIRNSNNATDKVTLWRGNAAHSTIKINAFVDNLQDAVSLVPFTGASNEGLTSAGYAFDVTARVGDSIAGVLFRADSTLTRRGMADVEFYHDTVPTLAAGLPSEMDVRYRFLDVRTGAEVTGSGGTDTTPTFA
jgi:hypothetical protein